MVLSWSDPNSHLQSAALKLCKFCTNGRLRYEFINILGYMKEIESIEQISNRIYFIRDKRVMLDRDMAEPYGVETKRLKEQVRRNIERFPDDFMFELSKSEFTSWRSQFATSNRDKIGLRYSPMAFTEQGVAMLPSVLRSKPPIQANIQLNAHSS
jgi:hypothetical protein